MSKAGQATKPRRLALTQAHLLKIARPVPKSPQSALLLPLQDREMEALADRLVSEIDEDGFWVFAYGSLIWNPGFDHIVMRRSVAQGWRRSFT